MKNSVFITTILLSILLPGTSQCQPNTEQPLRRKLIAARKSARLSSRSGTEIRGNISTQKASEQIPEFRILFDGKETKSNSEGFFSFPIEENAESEYSLVICKKLQQNFEQGNTLQSVNLIPNKNYRHFTLKKNFLTKTWHTKEKLLKIKNFAIPKHSLVILVDPKFVYSIQPWDVQLSDDIIKLPKITLTDTKKLARASAKSLLYSLDLTSFHEPVKQEKQENKDPKLSVSLAQ